MAPGKWISPDGKIEKVVVVYGTGGSKPTEWSECDVLFKGSSSLECFNDNPIVVGNNDGELGRLLDAALQSMLPGEKSEYKFHTENPLEFTLELLSFKSKGLIYQWNAQFKYEIAELHKVRGNGMFFEGRFADATQRYNKSLKILSSIPINVENTPDEIDGLKLTEIETLKTVLFNNMASCFTQLMLWDRALAMSEKVLARDPGNSKAEYKLGLACLRLGDFERARDMLVSIGKKQPNNALVKTFIEQCNNAIRVQNQESVETYKRMFR